LFRAEHAFRGAASTYSKISAVRNHYVFGKINKDILVDAQKTDIRDVYSGYEMRLPHFTGKSGPNKCH
jgi:hypothetical protein